MSLEDFEAAGFKQVVEAQPSAATKLSVRDVEAQIEYYKMQGFQPLGALRNLVEWLKYRGVISGD